MRAKITIYSIYDVRVNHTTYVELDEYDLDDNGELPRDYHDSLWQDAINDFCSDTVIEIVGDDE